MPNFPFTARDLRTGTELTIVGWHPRLSRCYQDQEGRAVWISDVTRDEPIYPLYRHRERGTLYYHTWTFGAVQYPVELTPVEGSYHIHVSDAELQLEYEAVV